MDDTWLYDDVFVQNLQGILEDKLYGHDEKKMVQKVELKKEPEHKLREIENRLENFYYNFADSLKNVFGYVSYKKFQEYLDTL